MFQQMRKEGEVRNPRGGCRDVDGDASPPESTKFYLESLLFIGTNVSLIAGLYTIVGDTSILQSQHSFLMSVVLPSLVCKFIFLAFFH